MNVDEVRAEYRRLCQQKNLLLNDVECARAELSDVFEELDALEEEAWIHWTSEEQTSAEIKAMEKHRDFYQERVKALDCELDTATEAVRAMVRAYPWLRGQVDEMNHGSR